MGAKEKEGVWSEGDGRGEPECGTDEKIKGVGRSPQMKGGRNNRGGNPTKGGKKEGHNTYEKTAGGTEADSGGEKKRKNGVREGIGKKKKSSKRVLRQESGSSNSRQRTPYKKREERGDKPCVTFPDGRGRGGVCNRAKE